MRDAGAATGLSGAAALPAAAAIGVLSGGLSLFGSSLGAALARRAPSRAAWWGGGLLLLAAAGLGCREYLF